MFETPDVGTQPVKRFDTAMRYVYDIKFGMLQVRKNEISLRECSGSSAHLRTLEETLVIRKSARFDNNDSEPTSQVSKEMPKLGSFSSQKKIKIFQRHILSKAFCHFPNVLNENQCLSRRGICRP